MPRPSKLVEEARIKAWQLAHPKTASMPSAETVERSNSDKMAIALFWGGVAVAIALLLLGILLDWPVVLFFLLTLIPLCMIYPILHFTRRLRWRIVAFAAVGLCTIGLAFGILIWGKPATEAKSYAPPASPGTAVLVQPGAKWISTDDTVNGAIENRGKVDSENLQVNPTNPSSPPVTHDRVVLNQLFKFIEEGVSLRQESDFKSWNTKVGQYISDNVEKSLAAKFVEAPSMGAKRRVLGECIQLVTQKIHAR